MPRAPTYSQALREIYSLDKFGSRLGLKRISALLEALDHPERDYKCVLVAGSNGKGSTTEFIGACLSAQGLRVGTYFSPQVEEFPERFRVNGKNAGKSEIANAYFKVRQACRRSKTRATFFETITAMALVIFKARGVDFAVLEVGLGGRLDATNAVAPELSVLTSVSLEHTQVLGKTIGEIAHEKCGVARKGRPLVCGFLSDEAKAAVKKECRKIGARLILAGEEAAIGKTVAKGGRHSFSASFKGEKYRICLSAPGKFQVSNACAALAACRLLGVPKLAIEKGLSSASPKFRLQALSRKPLLLADCAHNPEAAAALASEVSLLPQRLRVLLFSAMADKDYPQALCTLAPHFSHLVLCEVSLARSAQPHSLFAAAKPCFSSIEIIREPARALAAAKKAAGKNGAVVAAGSIYLLAELFGRDKIRLAQ